MASKILQTGTYIYQVLRICLRLLHFLCSRWQVCKILCVYVLKYHDTGTQTSNLPARRSFYRSNFNLPFVRRRFFWKGSNTPKPRSKTTYLHYGRLLRFPPAHTPEPTTAPCSASVPPILSDTSFHYFAPRLSSIIDQARVSLR